MLWRYQASICGAVICLAIGTAPAFADPFDVGRKALDKGKFSTAAASFSKLLLSGELDPKGTAKAFYLRGLAYQKTGKSAQAISDLTNALWLSGLSGDERRQAHLTRAAAYEAAGQAKRAAEDRRAADSAPKVAAVAAAGGGSKPGARVAAATPPPNAPPGPDAPALSAAPTPGPVVRSAPSNKPATSGGGFSFSNLFGGVFGGTTPQQKTPTGIAAAPTKPAAGTGPAVSSWSSVTETSPPTRAAGATKASPAKPNTRVAAAERAPANWSSSVTSAKPAAARAPAKARPASTASPESGGFFSNLFGGSAAAKPKPAAKPKRVARAPATPTGWSTAIAQTATKPARAASARQAVKPGKARAGRFNLQVATVRDKTRAIDIANSVTRQHSKLLAGLRPRVDATVIGNMGTYYRVRVDGLRTRQASLSLCNKLQAIGHDCFLIGN